MIRVFYVLLLLLLLSFDVLAEKVTIEADSLSTKDNLTTATGSVLIIYNDMVVSSDKAMLDRTTNLVELEGNVVFKDKDNIIRAEYAKIYLDNKTGFFRKGKGFYAPWSYFAADRLEKLEGNSFLLDNASLTTCSGDNPDWSFSANNARIDVGQYFKAKHSFANIKDVPVLYFPYFVWPIKKERQSGFLVPQFGFSSSKGFFITPKYFWAIDVDKDMTTGLNVFSNNGLMVLNEFRYAVSKKERIHIIGEFIDDKDSDADKESRWRLYGVGNKFIADNLEFRFNVNYASDFRYKRDFKDYNMVDKLPGMDPNKNEYIAEFRLNYYNKYGDLTIRYKDSMQFYDNVNSYTKDNLYQKPNIQLEKHSLGASYLKFDYLIDYNFVEKRSLTYYNENNEVVSVYNYERLNSRIKLYKPFDLKIATFTPFYTQYATYWYNFSKGLSPFEEKESSFASLKTDEDAAARYIYTLGYSINLNEIYKNYDNFRHSFYNTLEYFQTPEINQSVLPNSIEYDRIERQNLYRYTMTNYIKSVNYILKLEFVQGYNQSLVENKWTPLQSKLSFNYLKTLFFDFEKRYNYYTGQIEYYKNSITLSHLNLYLTYTQSFDKNIVNGDNANAGLKIGGRFDKFDLEFYKKVGKIDNRFRLNPATLDNREFYSKLLYKSECWSLGLLYKEDSYMDLTKTGSDKKRERVVFVLIELKGIGATQREIYRN
ncbi:MAG: hypothetical protein N3C60_07615 [Calditerrivibrio sp.]|nr:hypothetical protein [Calditerrivibrio sp.]